MGKPRESGNIDQSTHIDPIVLAGRWGGCKPLPAQLFWAQRPTNHDAGPDRRGLAHPLDAKMKQPQVLAQDALWPGPFLW